MNISETRQLLTMIWSLFPNAPKLSQADKEAMVIVWIDLLYPYKPQDVWLAVKRCVEREPRFVPSAPEIKANVSKTLDWDKHKSAECLALEKKFEELGGELEPNEMLYEKYRLEDMRKYGEEITEEDLAQWNAMLERSQMSKMLRNKYHREAEIKALEAYDREVKEKLIEDGTLQKLPKLCLT